MAATKRSVSVPLPPLTTRQAEAVIDALNAILGQMWDAYGAEIHALHDFQADMKKELRRAAQKAQPPAEDDPAW